MRTLFLNPPSFEGFDGGASSRWPASREIESYWYPVWLCYPAGMLPDSKVVDAPPHKISIEQTIEMGKDFELPDEGNLLDHKIGILHQVARLPHFEKRARVNPDFTFEQLFPLLPGSDQIGRAHV